VGPALYFPKEELLRQNLERLCLAVLAMVLLVFRSIPYSVLADIDAILKMEDTEVSCERVSNDSLALD
jgi:L-cystine uptake protein TcyP (sodium:dicarboxylate symporter family)